MKKIFYLPLLLSAFLPAMTSCSAPEPEGGLPIDDAVYVDEDDSQDPLKSLVLTSYSCDSYSYSRYFLQFQGEYSYAGYPTKSVLYRTEVYPSDDVEQTTSLYRYNVAYTYNRENLSSFPESVKITKDLMASDWMTIEDIEMTDMTFDNGLLMAFNFTSDKDNASHQVSLSYDNERLITIMIDNLEYTQKWDSNGDLIEINSPHFGKSLLTYSSVKNRADQWDPELPLFGFMQTFGWFGKAPAHYPKSIKTAARVYGNVAEDVEDIALDYYISWDKYFNEVKANTGLSSSAFNMSLTYQSIN
ncbi:MAG: hypothetical protein HDR48_00340 [Bacteroides sp.]|nr:hypothetical protein [Bacteroides sp.]